MSDGTAQAGVDYTPTSSTLTFVYGGETSMAVSVPVLDDSQVAGGEDDPGRLPCAALNAKGSHTWTGRGDHRTRCGGLPLAPGLASHAGGLRLPLPFERPVEERERRGPRPGVDASASPVPRP